MKLIHRGTPFIPVVPRCIMTRGNNSSGQGWSARLLAMCQNMIPTGRSRPITWSQEDYCNCWVSRIRSGMTSAWTSLWSYRWLRASLIQFGWSWIDSPNPPTLYPFTPSTEREVCQDLHRLCSMSAWSSEDDHFWSRVAVCCSLLGATTCFSRNSLDP
jgi:hypothetical protein